MRFTKGHGTENDFVLVPDHQGGLDLTPALVRHLADRRAGIGGDGVIRVVRTDRAQEPEVRALAGEAEWFMDYRNADGSAAEMCGNGTRVFAAYLLREGLATGDAVTIATRAGVKRIHVAGETYAVDLGPATMHESGEAAQRGFNAVVVLRGAEPLPALRVDVGTPHTVVMLPAEADLSALDLTVAPLVDPEPVEGTNVEVVHLLGPGHIAMRVHERGVGETRSCGTGAVAAAAATRWWEGPSADNAGWRVDVPGGRLDVTFTDHGSAILAGPAILVADGELR